MGVKRQHVSSEKGSVIVSILFVTLLLTTFVYGLLVLANSNLSRSRSRLLLLEAQYAAESGADTAIAKLNADSSYAGSNTETTVLDHNTSGNSYKATFTVTVASGSTASERIVSANGFVYAPRSSSSPSFTRHIEITAQRNSTNSTTGLISRNIIEIDSGVKNITGVDVIANGYIHMNKNTTNLIAENITVGGKNTGVGNCSIDGIGNLLKPGSFTHAGQTKTNIVVAYNNCISPPGNTSNSNFNVLANQSNITKVSSTNIPWSQYMDNSYKDAGSCSDWTTGSSPRNIPASGNNKKTHYPDSGSNVSTACGSNGDLSLGSSQYNIKDHVHIRANLCVSSACSPTFYNPDQGAVGIKFVFVEGTVNFDRLTTAAGSGLIVFVVYGSDPAAKAAVCPLGGAVYVGNGGTSNAPAAYLLANNGLCLDKTKWAVSPALGGVSGKNIYIATNPGTPFDLKLDPSFPVSSIPINLSWRAVRYRRL